MAGRHLRGWSLIVACIAVVLGALAPVATAARPNVIVILLDDVGWSDIGCYGGEVPTPNLDALAANGVRFTQFYNTGRCSPTRASLMTGQYPHQVGMGHLDTKVVPGSPGYQGRLADSSVTMAQVLREAGYFTAITGKWHLGLQHGEPPWDHGFDRSLITETSGIYFANQGGPKGETKLWLNGERRETDDLAFGEDWYGTDLWTKFGLKFIDEAKGTDKPFFLYLAHTSAHFPLMAPREDIDRYRGKYMVGWDKLREARHQRQIEMGLVDAKWGLAPRPETTPAWDDVPADKRDRFDHLMAIYAAVIDRVDRSIGTLIAGLKERGELDNTLILFMSDNGGTAEGGPDGTYQGDSPGGRGSNIFYGQNWATLSNTPFRKSKRHVHEGGISSPLIVHWPAGLASSRHGELERQPAHLIDIMATVVEATGAKYPATFDGHAIAPMEGVSLLPAVAGMELARTQPIFFEHEGHRAVREGKWKLVAAYKGPWELYDMEADRTELHDLSREHPELVERLSKAYDAWAERTHVEPWPVGPEPKKGKKKAKSKKKG